MNAAILQEAAEAELAQARAHTAVGETEAAWANLAKAHMISQPVLLVHLKVHSAMLALAVTTGAVGEMIGQLVRLVLAPLGHVLGRIPWGNSGLSNVSPFRPASLPSDIMALYSRAGVEVKNA
jgi:hypothetical protein